MKKTVLITGGSGFIGTNFCLWLADHTDWRIRVFDRQKSTPNVNRKSVQGIKKVEIVKGDILSRRRLEVAMKDCDYVVHLAAETGVTESLDKPKKVLEVNVLGTNTVYQAAVKCRVKKVVLASSGAALGTQKLPLREFQLPKPLSIYGVSKLAGESLGRVYAAGLGLTSVSLRFTNVYGPWSMHKISFIHYVIKQLLADKKVVVYGDGEQTRDFIFVEDACRAIYLALTNEAVGGYGLFHVGTGRETSINQIVVGCEKMIGGRKPRVVRRAFRQKEVRRNYTQTKLIADMLGFQPRCCLDMGLKKTIEWYRQNGKY